MSDKNATIDDTPLLSVRDLSTVFRTDRGPVYAVNGVSIDVPRGEIVGIIGESGSGKSQLCLSVMRLLAESGRVTSGSVLLNGRDLLCLADREMRAVRGEEIAMIFQEPSVGLDPLFTVGQQLVETIRRHRPQPVRLAREHAAQLLASVGIARPTMILDEYPQKLSGGMCQRVMIALGLSCEPQLLIADEPTTALDVTVQAQILDLLLKARDDHGSSILFVTHDLGVIAEICDHVAVMYAGQIVERSPVDQLFDAPQHPYTRALLRSRPLLSDARVHPLPTIPGQVPRPGEQPQGCPFHPRCPDAMSICHMAPPPVHRVAPRRDARCWLLESEADRAQASEGTAYEGENNE